MDLDVIPVETPAALKGQLGFESLGQIITGRLTGSVGLGIAVTTYQCNINIAEQNLSKCGLEHDVLWNPAQKLVSGKH